MLQKTRQSRLTTSRRLRHESLDDRRMLAVIMVSTLEDTVDPSDGVVSLREAVAEANESDHEDIIRFDADLVRNSGTIDLALGQINIRSAITIEGPGAGFLVIDAAQRSRILSTDTGNYQVVISGLTLRNGRTDTETQTPSDDSSGPALLAQHSGLTFLRDLVVEQNHAEGIDATGAVSSTAGDLVIEDSDFQSNRTAGNHGTGGAVSAAADLLIERSQFVGNSTSGFGAHGGAVFALGQANVVDSLFSDNQTFGVFSRGGGIFASGDLTITESVVSDNRTSNIQSGGGGVIAYSNVNVDRSQIVNNVAMEAQFGGGMLIVGRDADTNLAISGSTIRGNRVLLGEGDDIKFVSQTGSALRVLLGSDYQLGIGDAHDFLLSAAEIQDGQFMLTATRVDSVVAELVIETRFPWANPLRPSDVNNDGVVSALDALVVINELNARRFSSAASGELNDPATINWPGVYFDQNGDGNVSALDALRVINDLNRVGSRSSAESELPGFDPEGRRSRTIAAVRTDAAIALLF